METTAVQAKAQERDGDPRRKTKWVWDGRKKGLKSRKQSRPQLIRRRKSWRESAKRRRRRKRLRKKISLQRLPSTLQSAWIRPWRQRSPLWLSRSPLQIPVAAVVKRRRLLRKRLPKPPPLPLRLPVNRTKQSSVLLHRPRQKPPPMKPPVTNLHPQPKTQDEGVILSRLLLWSRPAAVLRNRRRAHRNSHPNPVPPTAKRRSSLWSANRCTLLALEWGVRPGEDLAPVERTGVAALRRGVGEVTEGDLGGRTAALNMTVMEPSHHPARPTHSPIHRCFFRFVVVVFEIPSSHWNPVERGCSCVSVCVFLCVEQNTEYPKGLQLHAPASRTSTGGTEDRVQGKRGPV